MGYSGSIVPIRFGTGGLLTDIPQPDTPPTHLLRADNVIIKHKFIEKAPGSRRFNNSALPSGIIALTDWRPNTVRQFFVTTTSDGKVTKLADALSQVEVTASGSAPTTLVVSAAIQPFFLSAGLEDAGRDRKLFLFSPENQVQVIAGTQDVRTNIASPPTDWTGSFPVAGGIFRNRMFGLGGSDPHRIYFSLTSDHEDFTTTPVDFTIFPGEGDGLIGGVVYKGRLFLFKEPEGVYFIDDPDDDPANWGVKKLTGEFGLASPHAITEALDDLLLGNSTGSITSHRAVTKFGDIESGDTLALLDVEEFIREIMSTQGLKERHAVYDQADKLAYFTYRSSGGIRNDRMLVFDFTRQRPELTVFSKDQASVLTLRRESDGTRRPYYGANDGFIYELRRKDRNVAGVGYKGEFQIPYLDFGFLDPAIRDQNKIWDHLEIEFVQTGKFDLFVDVFQDDRFVNTITFNQIGNDPVLDTTFELDKGNTSRLAGVTPLTFRRPLVGVSRRISFRFRNAVLNENFKLTGCNVYFRVSGQQQNNRG